VDFVYGVMFPVMFIDFKLHIQTITIIFVKQMLHNVYYNERKK